METRALALCELSSDLLYHRIPKPKLSYYIEESLRMGTEAAGLYKGCDLNALYQKHEIAVSVQEDGTAAFGMAYRGEITLKKGNCSAVIFRSSIHALAKHSEGPRLPGIDYELAGHIHLAHEFFHFLEFKSGSYVSQVLDSITTMKVLGLERKARINRCSEVAAHAFAKALLGLKVLPNYYDYRYLINTGKMTEEAFAQMLEKYRKELNVKFF